MRTSSELFPLPTELVELGPEDVAALLLVWLNQGTGRNFSRYNLLLRSGEIGGYSGNLHDEVARAITQAWIVLEREGLIAPEPNSHGGEWSYVTKRGREVQLTTDFRVFQRGNLLPRSSLDPVLALHARPIFLREDYDTAVLRAFKEVEIRTRTVACLGEDCIGVKLMRTAFHAEDGGLTDQTKEAGEKQAVSDLFAGAVGCSRIHRVIGMYPTHQRRRQP
jgi:Protein of unknown function (Hypoth_ymh)